MGATFGFTGEHYTLVDSPALPKPVQAPIPVLVGGAGKKRTPHLAATYAHEFNMPFASLEDTEAQFGRVRSACDAVDRDPAELVYSAALTVCVGADEAEVLRRASAIGRDVRELRAEGVAGTPNEALQTLNRFEEIGCERVYLQVMDLTDLDHLRLVADAVMPFV